MSGKQAREVAGLITQRRWLTVRAIGQGTEGVDELARGEAGRAGLSEDIADVG